MTREEAIKSMMRSSSFRTICEVHREIYEACEDPKVKELVIEAFIMGKRIDAKLREYNPEWSAGFYEVNADRRDDRHNRQ